MRVRQRSFDTIKLLERLATVAVRTAMPADGHADNNAEKNDQRQQNPDGFTFDSSHSPGLTRSANQLLHLVQAVALVGDRHHGNGQIVLPGHNRRKTAVGHFDQALAR